MPGFFVQIMQREIQQNEILKGSGFHHVAVRTHDWDASLKFWIEGLGFHKAIEWSEAPTRACMLDMGDGNYLELFEREKLANIENSTEVEAPILHFCLRTEDVDAATEKARAAGATITVEPVDPPVFTDKGLKIRISFFVGPGGEVCEFFQSDIL